MSFQLGKSSIIYGPHILRWRFGWLIYISKRRSVIGMFLSSKFVCTPRVILGM
ncbi:hypothetical protein HMPREF0742_01624 [Rothia aeria F0184]|uniref:Uncharacterized protein n=1 Tax=Rothia aeria F0184 TaxID=888019 RepID=U7V2M6_9MICC|nr:hypothetical protein HMPREF0742_01624 [Rothia aeria F0184]